MSIARYGAFIVAALFCAACSNLRPVAPRMYVYPRLDLKIVVTSSSQVNDTCRKYGAEKTVTGADIAPGAVLDACYIEETKTVLLGGHNSEGLIEMLCRADGTLDLKQCSKVKW